MRITEKVRLFVEAMISGLSQADSYRRAYNCEKMKDSTILRRASEIACDSDVKALLSDLRARAAEKVITQAADVAEEMLRIHATDATQIVQHRRLNCRYCNGINNLYQWKNEHEFDEALLAHGRGKRVKGAPSDAGGYGFRFNAQPSPTCPHCFGEGIPDVFIADTRFLTKDQKRLIQGIKMGKSGVEVKFRDQDGALKAAGQMLGGFKSTVTIQNPDGTPITPATPAPVLPADPLTASQIYSEWIKNASKG